jgi:hypothetical protein
LCSQGGSWCRCSRVFSFLLLLLLFARFRFFLVAFFVLFNKVIVFIFAIRTHGSDG